MNTADQVTRETESVQMGEDMDSYLERCSRGERPNVEEYAEQYPDLADVIRKMLPTLDVMHLSEGLEATVDKPQGETIQPQGPLGDFRIVREIGRGGMGVVYEAEQISLGRTVALKVLPFAAAMDSRHLQRFKNEALAAAHLDHPHIVDVYGVGCDRGVHYYAMRFIEGQSLAHVIEDLSGHKPPEKNLGLLTTGSSALVDEVEDRDETEARRDAGRDKREPNITPTAHSTEVMVALSTEHSANSREYFRSVARLGKQTAEALEHAHQMGVIHRDVKPANLLLDLRGNLWVADFGLAHVQSSTQLTMTGDLLGTLRYMSPEEAFAKRITIDHRTNVYSLGTTLYELLALEPAFSGRDRQELLRQIAFEEPKPPRRGNPSIPVELETIVLKAIAKNPDERYATAQEMADDLERFIDDKPIRARRPTLAQHVARLGRRHRSVAVTIGISMVLAVIGLAISTTVISALYHNAEEANENLAATVEDRDEALDNLQKKTDETEEAFHAERTANEQLAEANAREKENNYSYAVALAHRSALEGDFSHARTLLKGCPEELRQWEWHYTRSLCSSDFIQYKPRVLSTLAPRRSATPRGRERSGSAGDQGRHIPGQGRRRTSSRPTLRTPLKAVFRPGKPALAIPEGGAVTILDATSGEVLYRKQGQLGMTFSGSSALGVCAYSPDGDLLAVSLNEPSVRVLDAESGDERCLLEGYTRSVADVAFSPDGKWLASSSADGTIRVWDLADRECKHTWSSGGGVIWQVFFLGEPMRYVSPYQR